MNEMNAIRLYLDNPHALYGEGWHLASMIPTELEAQAPEGAELLLDLHGEPQLFLDREARWAYSLDGESLGTY